MTSNLNCNRKSNQNKQIPNVNKVKHENDQDVHVLNKSCKHIIIINIYSWLVLLIFLGIFAAFFSPATVPVSTTLSIGLSIWHPLQFRVWLLFATFYSSS